MVLSTATGPVESSQSGHGEDAEHIRNICCRFDHRGRPRIDQPGPESESLSCAVGVFSLEPGAPGGGQFGLGIIECSDEAVERTGAVLDAMEPPKPLIAAALVDRADKDLARIDLETVGAVAGFVAEPKHNEWLRVKARPSKSTRCDGNHRRGGGASHKEDYDGEHRRDDGERDGRSADRSEQREPRALLGDGCCERKKYPCGRFGRDAAKLHNYPLCRQWLSCSFYRL
jgi:hypothetical protein